jgi:enolase
MRRVCTTIAGVNARQIIDSRGNPTVEVDIFTNDNQKHTASVPSGASTGIYEAHELRDKNRAYLGKSVYKAVDNIKNVIGPKILGMNPSYQRDIDEVLIKLDGSENKSNLGANALLGVSLAVSKAGAHVNKLPLYTHYSKLANKDGNILPTPCFNVINGGEHAGNMLPFQEFFIIPTGASSFSEAMQIGCETFHVLKETIKNKYSGDATLIGDEGGFAPPCDVSTALELLSESIQQSGYTSEIELGLDVAASEFKVERDGESVYDLNFKGREEQLMSGDEMVNYYNKLIEDYKIISIEDPFDQDDWKNWSKLVNSVDGKCQIVGDDLTVTNKNRISRAVKENAANCLLLKVNQIGTITESIDSVNFSYSHNWNVMASHRSGETEDTYLADLSVGLSTRQIKTGAPCRGERTAKYNQLLRIEEELGSYGTYAGKIIV